MSLSPSAREKLYDAEVAKARAAGRGDLPICNICDGPINGAREEWHESHDPQIPKHMGGDVTGIAHAKCNLKHNNEHDTPLYWKRRRTRQKYIGAKIPRSRLPNRRSPFKLKMNGQVVDRRTGAPWRP
jgi:hypothetical protein